jgi:hypothetical protein
MLVCAFCLLPLHARPRVQRAPGLPCVPLGIALRPIFRANEFSKPGRMMPRDRGFVSMFHHARWSGWLLTFVPGKTGFHPASGRVARFRIVLPGVGCPKSVQERAGRRTVVPPSPSLVLLQFGHESEIRLSVQPGRVYPALFAESGRHRDKTASMTPESYCEAFGRPYVRP